ncbi:hypothetical protein [Methanolacinia petrolearia]|nr:hypothetical protein [Methanolacinia petrolearia]
MNEGRPRFPKGSISSVGNPCAGPLRGHALTSGFYAIAITRPGRYPSG